MTDMQKLLALDAALLACTGLDAGDEISVSVETMNLIKALKEAVLRQTERQYADTPFDLFLKDQKEAVLELVKSEIVFGGE